MCLIIFDWQEHTKELTLLANRDEFFSRPASAIDYWSSHPEIFGGRDLSAGGTWLAVSKAGRLAAVTNYREVPAPNGNISRGEIPVAFLSSEHSAASYAQRLAQEHTAYSGFNALLFDGETLVYSSNKNQEPIILSSGVYGVSNQLLNTPWPKLLKAKQGYLEIREQAALSAQARENAWLNLMCDRQQAREEDLPDTGIGTEGEKFLSSIFIRSQAYGTRATSLVSMRPDKIRFIERSFSTPEDSNAEHKVEGSTRHETIRRAL
jgi:uncharacterized protein with NRDE domain